MDRPPAHAGEVTNSFPRLLAAARGGSRASLGRLLEAGRTYLLAVANGSLDADLRAKCDGSDLVQQTLLQAVKNWHSFDGRTEDDLLAWLRRILLNRAADLNRDFRATGKRRLGREVRLDDGNGSEVQEQLVAPVESPSHCAMAEEERERVAAAVARLPSPYREVVELHNREHLSFVEIGRRLGVSADAVRKLWSRAVDKLQKMLLPRGKHT